MLHSGHILPCSVEYTMLTFLLLLTANPTPWAEVACGPSGEKPPSIFSSEIIITCEMASGDACARYPPIRRRKGDGPDGDFDVTAAGHIADLARTLLRLFDL
ncbi:MAG: hypothetical protein AB1640_25395 [bacterium]